MQNSIHKINPHHNEKILASEIKIAYAMIIAYANKITSEIIIAYANKITSEIIIAYAIYR
jgi:hypothetical protein